MANRRQLLQLTGMALLGATALSTAALAQQVDNVSDPTQLKPGQWMWHPEASPNGSVSIIVSLPEQLCYVYRGGVLIALSTVSSGRPGYSTPTGVFTILSKQTDHYSKEYKADMPNSEFVTTTGVALHAGGLPGYPSSHGCVHLPLEFSKLLYTITQDGTPVVITNSRAQPPQTISHPGAVLSQAKSEESAATASHSKAPVAPAAPAPAAAAPKAAAPADGVPVKGNTTAVIVSRADQSITVMEHGKVIAQGKAIIQNPDQAFGSHLFILEKSADEGLTWHEISYAHGSEPATPADVALIKRVETTPDVADVMKDKMQPGMLMVMTDQPAADDTRTSDGTLILLDQESKS